jgi:hypothetical protein
MRKAIIATMVIAGMLMLTVSVSWAGQYKLRKGKQYQVCKVYTDYLNSFDPPKAMICERPYNPSFKVIAKPKWRPIHAAENLPLIDQIMESRISPGRESVVMTSPGFVETKKFRKEAAQKGLIQLYFADINIDNRGGKELILRYDGPVHGPLAERCGATKGPPYYRGVTLMPNLYLMKDERTVDKKETRQLQFNYDVFFYDGRTFLDLWTAFPMKPAYEPGKGGGGIAVYEFNRVASQGDLFGTCVCEMEYEE